MSFEEAAPDLTRASQEWGERIRRGLAKDEPEIACHVRKFGGRQAVLTMGNSSNAVEVARMTGAAIQEMLAFLQRLERSLGMAPGTLVRLASEEMDRRQISGVRREAAVVPNRDA